MSSTLADLQRRNLEKMGVERTDIETVEPLAPPASDKPSVLTEARKSVLTGLSTEAGADLRKELSTPASTEGRTDAHDGVSKSARAAARKGAGADSVQGRSFLDAVEARLTSREPLVGGVKATVDMSPELSSRAKRYLADRRGQNTRQVLIALLDAYLAEKGY